MLARGTDKLTRQQIADEMTRLQMTGGLALVSDDARKPAGSTAAAGRTCCAMRRFPATEYQQLQRELVTRAVVAA